MLHPQKKVRQMNYLNNKKKIYFTSFFFIIIIIYTINLVLPCVFSLGYSILVF